MPSCGFLFNKSTISTRSDYRGVSVRLLLLFGSILVRNGSAFSCVHDSIDLSLSEVMVCMQRACVNFHVVFFDALIRTSIHATALLHDLRL